MSNDFQEKCWTDWVKYSKYVVKFNTQNVFFFLKTAPNVLSTSYMLEATRFLWKTRRCFFIVLLWKVVRRHFFVLLLLNLFWFKYHLSLMWWGQVSWKRWRSLQIDWWHQQQKKRDQLSTFFVFRISEMFLLQLCRIFNQKTKTNVTKCVLCFFSGVWFPFPFAECVMCVRMINHSYYYGYPIPSAVGSHFLH